MLPTTRGRIIMEPSISPIVIPMWLTGFDKLMPEGRTFPYKYFPRPGTRLSVTFGNPLISEINKALRDSHTPPSRRPSLRDDEQEKKRTEASPEQNNQRLDDVRNLRDVEIRTEITALVQKAVESLGRSMYEDTISQSI